MSIHGWLVYKTKNMKDKIISVNLETSTAPVVAEARGRDWIEYGDANGDWRNLYPQFLIDLYYSSSISAAIINATSEMISGKDIIIEDEDERDLEARVKLQHFLDSANSNETLHEVLVKASFDFKLQGGFALNIVYSQDRTQIAEVYHLDVSKLRCSKPDEFGKTTGYYISSDWTNTRQNKPYYVPAFNPNDRTSANQILYAGLYSPNMNSYYIPDYISCNNWSLLDGKISEFHLQNVSNGFSGSYMISFANGIPTAEERNEIERSLASKFTGENNAGKFILTFSDDKTRVPEITPISPSDLDKQFLALQELLVSNITSGHRITSKTLMGLDSGNGFSSNADELNSAANFYHNTVIVNFQNRILKVLSKIFKVNDMDMPVQFVQLKPITTKFTNQDLAAVLTPDEIREEMGYEPLDVDVEVREDFSKVGMVDGKPVFSTIEEAEAHSKTLGCVGYHEHDLDGTTGYMACEGHEEATELSKFIEEFGEDMPKDWELVSEEEAEEELEGFDFETELNSDYYEFASTGSAYPNRKSGQDQKSKQTDYKDDIYRVRYRYVGSLTGERDFCRKMTNANKIYRKEDIIAMGTKAVNPGWGKGGANTYSIWKWKGGALCEHKWNRIILVQEGNKPKNSDEIISATQAKSRGIKLPRNAKEVSVAPHDMPNHGFVNPELIAKYKNV
jgi:hypothetical protein|tara:strand:+ start:1898 stop:3931 length:2034 start_codon:yes stop_codon:yes gene_type:complete